MNNKYKTNNKINLYKENLIKFIITQKKQIILIETIDYIDYIIGILFLTETNKYCKQNKINVHGYYLAYSFINLFNKIKNKLYRDTIINVSDMSHFILSLNNNIDYLNSRIDPTNIYKNKINNNLSKLIIEITPILNDLILYNKIHNEENENEKENLAVSNYKKKFCNINCYNCWITNVLSKFFYLLLQTAKFLGSGSYNDPNLIRLSEYYANIFYTLFKSKEIIKNNINENKIYSDIYENYLNYKNKLNYSLIELNLNSETLDEIINFLDNEILKNLSIVIK